jgi:hypothetical protein
MVFWQRRKIAACEHLWLMMVSTLSYPQPLGRPMIRSMAICKNGGELVGTLILYRGIWA